MLLRGESGAGKSDLALRLIDGGAVLVADDRTVLHCAAGRVLLSAPEALRGRIEVRGIGIVPVPSVADIPLALVVDLVPSRAVERMPEARYETFCGMAVPALSLDPRESSAPAKVRLGVCAATCGILFGQD
ncbi:MAG: HPr kinase/phosphatase C-terminal domain-containing protein [Alphaproteobacteria bacterium]